MDNHSNRRKPLISVLWILAAITAILVFVLAPRVEIATGRPELVSFPEYVALLSGKLSDKEIIKKLQGNPVPLKTHWPEAPVYYMRTPLLLVLEYDRKKVAEYMIEKEISVERTKKILSKVRQRDASSIDRQLALLQKLTQKVKSQEGSRNAK